MQTHQVRWAPLPARPRSRPRSPSVPPVPPAPPTWVHTDAQRCCGDSIGPPPRRPPWPSVSCVSLACEGMPHSSFPPPPSLQASRVRMNSRMEERSHQCCVREVLDFEGRPVSRTRTTVVKQLFLPPVATSPPALTPPPPPIVSKTKSLRPWSTGTVRATTAQTRSTCTHKEKAVGTDSPSNDSIKQQWVNPSEHRSSDSTSDDSSDHYGKALKFYVEVTLKPSSNPSPEGILDCLIGEQTSVNLLRSGSSSRVGESEMITGQSSGSSMETVVQVVPPRTLQSLPPTPTLASPVSEEETDQVNDFLLNVLSASTTHNAGTEWLPGVKSPTPSLGHFSPNPRIPSMVGHVAPRSQREPGTPLRMRSSSPISSIRTPSTVGGPVSAPVSFTHTQASRVDNTQTTRRISMSVIDRKACDDPPPRKECGGQWKCFQYPPRQRPQFSPVQPKESVAQVHQERRQKATEQRPETNPLQPGSTPAPTVLLGRALRPTLGSLASAVTGLLASAVSCAQTTAANVRASPPTSKSLPSNVPESSMPVTVSFAPNHVPQQHTMSEGDSWDSVSLPPAVALRLKTARDFLRMRMVSLSHAKMPSVLMALQTHRDVADTAASALDAFRAKIYQASWAAGKDNGNVTPSAKALVHELTYRLTEAEKEARDLAIACRSLQLKMLGLTGSPLQRNRKVTNTPVPYVNLHSEQAFDEAAVIKYLDEIVQSLDMRVTGPSPSKT